MPGRNKLHKQCVDYLDRYKACLIGMNTDKLTMATRRNLTDNDLQQKREEAAAKGIITRNNKTEENERIKI